MSAYWIACRDCGNGKNYEFSFKNVDKGVWEMFTCSSCRDSGGAGKRVQVSASLFDDAEMLTRADLAASGRAILF